MIIRKSLMLTDFDKTLAKYLKNLHKQSIFSSKEETIAQMAFAAGWAACCKGIIVKLKKRCKNGKD